MGLQIRRVRLTSPTQEPAEIRFVSGLNVVAGASNTGKSLLVEMIRYGLGAQEIVKKVVEAAPYDRLLLVIENDGGEQFTIERALAGGDAIVYAGDVSERPPAAATIPRSDDPSSFVSPEDAARPADGRVLPVRASATTGETLPGVLLDFAALAGRRIKDKQASTRNLTFRDLRELVIVDEQRIIATASPAQSGERTERSAEEAVLSLLLTGLDDAAIVIAEQAASEREEHQEKAHKIAFMLEELRSDVPDRATLRGARAQLKRIEASIAKAQDSYNEGFASVSALEGKRRALVRERAEVRSKSEALNQLVDRFTVLQSKYESDLQRLSAIGEAVEHFSILEGDAKCPVCGALFSSDSTHHRATVEDPAELYDGVEAERQKIIGLKRDLANTMEVLTRDIINFSRRGEELPGELNNVEERLNVKLKPKARELSEQLGQFMEGRAEIRELLSNLERIERYKNQRTVELAAVKNLAPIKTERNDTKAKYEFGLLVEAILRAWKYPEVGNVQFDEKSQDLIIGGKPRASLGKGYRALTASAFLVALMQFCETRKLPHPGFVVLDTPVRTFKDKKHGRESDEVVSDEVKEAFFYDLATRFPSRQIVVAENDTPPAALRSQINYVFFSGNTESPPAGFIPPSRDAQGA